MIEENAEKPQTSVPIEVQIVELKAEVIFRTERALILSTALSTTYHNLQLKTAEHQQLVSQMEVTASELNATRRELDEKCSAIMELESLIQTLNRQLEVLATAPKEIDNG